MTPEIRRLIYARTLLFVPAHRPDRFAKAAASGADDIIIDLEDAVSVELKSDARSNVRRWRAECGTGVVRVNDPSTQWFEDDIAALLSRPCAVMLPKVSNPQQIADLLTRLPDGSCAIPVIETAAGVLNAPAICAATGVARVAFGNGDLAAELGIRHEDKIALAHARSAVVLASAAARIPAPLDGVTTALHDTEALTADSQHAAILGFGGKLCVHPSQIPVVHAAFTPSKAQLEWATTIAATPTDGPVTTLDGQMIDKPIIERARQLLSTEANYQKSRRETVRWATHAQAKPHCQ